ncbi:MAG: hemolysin D [Planctomycetota bacterium]
MERSNGEGAAKRTPVQLASPEALAGAGIRTAPSTQREMKEFIEANAEVRYDTTRYAQVATRVPGSVVLVRAEVGGKVARGDVMALVDAAEVGRLKAELLQAAAQVEVRTKGLERSRVSVEKRFGTEAERQEADAALKEAQIRLFNACQALINLGLPAPEVEAGSLPSERELQLLGLPESIARELDPARTTANLIPIIAPLDGIVVSRSVVPGEVVEAAKPLFAVANTQRMWVVADVSVNEIPRLHLGQELTFLADGWGEPCAGPIAWISTEVDEKTRTVQVRADVVNDKGCLLAHMFGRARIAVRVSGSAVVVPSSAVQWLGDGNVVFVRANSEVFQTRNVRVGVNADGFTELLTGVSTGEEVATDGSYVLAAQLNRGKLGAGCTDD